MLNDEKSIMSKTLSFFFGVPAYDRIISYARICRKFRNCDNCISV